MFTLDKLKIRFIILFFTLMFASCIETNEKYSDFKSKSITVIGITDFRNNYIALKDSFNIWVLNRLIGVEAEIIYPYEIDSLICFNKDKNRFISCRHLYVNLKEATSDDLQFVYGEKINDLWYFFKGASIVVSRKMYQGHQTNIPLTYYQLHQIALKKIYNGYLNNNGEINEAWFTYHFENIGWGSFEDQASSDWFLKGKRFKTKREYFEFVHLNKVRNNWYGINKDSIKQLPPKIEEFR